MFPINCKDYKDLTHCFTSRLQKVPPIDHLLVDICMLGCLLVNTKVSVYLARGC